MNEKKLQQYAELLVKEGVRVQKGEELWVYGGVQNEHFINLVVEEAYKAGAKYVKVNWSSDSTERLTYKYVSLKNLSVIPPYRMAEINIVARNFLACFISMILIQIH